MGLTKKEDKSAIKLSQIAFSCLIIFFWTRHTLLNYVWVVMRKLPILNIFEPFAEMILFGMAILLSLPLFLRRMKANDVCFVGACILLVLLTIAFLPQNAEYIVPELSRILVWTIPVYLLGVAYDNENNKENIYWASLLGVLVAFAYQAYRMLMNRELASYDMNAAYNLLPSIVYLIYWAFEKRKWWYWIAAFLGFVLCVSYGTRGPILAAVVVFAALFVFWTFTGQRRVLKISILVALILGAGVAFASGMMATLATKITPLFEKLGFSTRIFDYFLEGNLTIDNGRDKLAEAVIQAIREKPLLGYGIMGDRLVLGSYVHNFVLEVLCSFGFLFGGALLLILLIVVLRGIFSARKQGSVKFLLAMSLMVIVKLLFSGSYIFEPYFFFVIGLCIGCCRNKKDTEASDCRA